MDLLNLLAPLIAACVTAPVSSWLTSVLLHKKHDTEVEQLKAQVGALQTNTKGDELKNVREGISILMEEVVEPLKKELNAVRREMARFRKAFGKGDDCKHYYDLCPIRAELLRTEEDSNNKHTEDRQRSGGRDPT